MRKRKRKQQKKNRRKKIIWYSVFLIVVLTGRFIISGRDDSMILTETKRNQIINSNEWKEIFEHSEDYPPVLLEDLKRNPELLDFVKKYPVEQTAQEAGLTFREKLKKYPLFIQWDERWGYSVYGDNMIAVNGCGPTAVAMVVSGLLCDPSVTPYKVAKFAEEQGYYAGESGTSWTLMSEGVQSFGIWGEELGLSRSEVFSALESGCPIICSMRPGDFTTTGHFIVLTKVENGKIKVNDPNSRIRSGQLWDYERLEPQIQNLWAFSRM